MATSIHPDTGRVVLTLPHGPDVYEDVALRESPIACAVADAFVTAGLHEVLPSYLVTTLSRLEAATRGSALRKVKP